MADSSETTYQQCAKIKLDRQVSSRDTANAEKVLFMREAAISFLKYIGEENGNKLECSVSQKLHNPLELPHLKADAMFHYVYYDLQNQLA